MKTWKLSIKPNNSKESDPFKLCKDNSMLGVGWAGAYKERQATNISEARELVKEKYNNKWPHAIKHLLEDVKSGDHIWLHQKGEYFLCKAGEEILFGAAIHKDFISYDLGHARKATWVKVPEAYVSGSIQRGTIAQRMIQKIWVTEEEQELHEFLFINLLNDKDWRPQDINQATLEDKISEMAISDMFSLMTPDDVEDVVSAYLQHQGWVLIKSTCFRSKPKFEFMMLNKDNETCVVQVKSGKEPNPLSPKDYEKHTSQGKTIYLFSTNQNPYPGVNIDDVKPITHMEMFSWIQKNIWALTNPLKQRLWIYFCAQNRACL